MIIADNNIIIQCFKDRCPLPRQKLIAPDDLYDEYRVAELNHNRHIPNLISASELQGFNQAYYLKKYYYYLNSYNDVHFVQMRGFADVSILALTASLIHNFGKPKQPTLFDTEAPNHDIVIIATEDKCLKKRLIKEFGDQIKIIGFEDIQQLS
jgi:hypothetical protein